MADPGLSKKLQQVREKLAEIIDRAEWLLDPKSVEAQGAAEGARAFVRLFFGAGQELRNPEDNKVPQLVVQGFDGEQIWEQLEVQNVPLRQTLRKRIPKLVAAPKGAIDLSVLAADAANSDEEDLPKQVELAKVPKRQREKTPKAQGSENEVPEEADEADDAEGAPEEQSTGQDFFDLDEMEKFADLTDGPRWRLEDDAEESDFDLLEAGDDDEEAGNITFNDFFGDSQATGEAQAEEDDLEFGDEDDEDEEDEKAAAKLDDLDEEERALEEQLEALGVQEEEEEEGDDGEDEEVDEGKKSDEKKTSLYDMDRRLKLLEEEVQKLEEEQLQEKSWEMKGEVFAKQRPLNSLLEVALDQPMTHFAARRAEDLAGDAEDEALEDAPGADTLAKTPKFDLEGIIKQRVWDEAFDDVVRKTQLPPSQRPQSAEEDAVETLNFEKSRVGLGDIYAKQYEAEMLGHQTDAAKAEDKEKAEIKQLFAKIMFKLDQLSNAHFTPRPPMVGAAADAAAKVPSLKMEETIPLMVSDAALQAPEEAKAPRRHAKDQEELSPDEKAAVRRSRKAARKKGLERKVEGGEMSLKDRRDRDQKLQEKNQKVKAEKASKGQVKDKQKRLKASELLAQAAENAKSDTSKKEEVRKQREARPENTPSSKRLKL